MVAALRAGGAFTSCVKHNGVVNAASGITSSAGVRLGWSITERPWVGFQGSRWGLQGARAPTRRVASMVATSPWPGVWKRGLGSDEDASWQFDPLGLETSARRRAGRQTESKEALTIPLLPLIGGRGPSRPTPGGASPRTGGPTPSGPEDTDFGLEDFFKGKLPDKARDLFLLLALSRLGVYLPLPGVDVDAFASNVQQGGLLSFVDTLSGGGISRVGVFSLGIVPYINAQIVFQLLTSVFPKLSDLQKKEGEAGRKQFQSYTRWAAVGLAVAQAVGQVLFLKDYAYNFDAVFLFDSVVVLTAGAMIEVYIAEVLTGLKLGNGTSLLIFANIVSYLPASIGRTVVGASEDGNWGGLAVLLVSFLSIIAGIVYVQEAERKIPMNYARRYSGRGLRGSTSYLPFKVNATGVMPVIFSSSLLAAPAGLARFTGDQSLKGLALALYPGGSFYLPTSVVLIAFFNYFYTFLQLDPDEVADQLKRQGASIPGIRPGRATAAYITGVLTRMSILGSVFLGFLAAAPALAETTTGLQAFRGFAGTSILILVGVATDSTRKIEAELVSQKYLTISDGTFDSSSQ